MSTMAPELKEHVRMTVHFATSVRVADVEPVERARERR